MAKTLKSFQMVDAVVLLMLQNDKFVTSVNKKRDKELRELVEANLGISARQAQRYIKEAREHILSMNDREKPEWLGKAVRRRELMIIETMKAKDYRTAHTIEKDLSELLGLYPDKKVQQETTNYDVDLSKFTEKGLERIKHGDNPKEVMLDPESIRLTQ